MTISQKHVMYMYVTMLTKTFHPTLTFFATLSITGASYGHYRSICQEESLKRRGKHTERNAVRRRKERLNRVCCVI